MDATTFQAVQLIVNAVLVPLVGAACFYLREAAKRGGIVTDRLEAMERRLAHIERKLRIRPRAD